MSYTNTHLDAGNTLIIKSGGDTNLKGAVANGKQIIADIGGNLNIESLQDTSVYASKQESASASATVGMGASQASASLNQSKINGNYASVTEQSGLKAGDGGFQVNVKGNTALIGAVIESSQAAIDAGNNSLITASLTSRDIQNRSEYDAQSISISASTGGTGMPMALNAGDSTTSVTKSGISGASITITDEAKQKQLTGKDAKETVATLNTDVTTGKDTSGAISNNLDVNEVQTGMTVTQAFVQQAGTFVANQAQKSDKLKAAGDAKKAEADKEPDPARKQQLLADAQNLYQQSTDTKDESAKWGASGTYGRIATALTAAAGGNVTSSTAQLVQGAAVNYIQSLGAEQVKHIADTLANQDGSDNAASGSVRAALHAIVACAGGSTQGNDCGSAALGASAGSLINSIMGGDPATMSAKEKENRTNLVATLVTGIAAATDASNIAAATSAAVIETENNFLSNPDLKKRNESLTVLRDAQGVVGYFTGKGNRSKAANDFLALDNKDTRSDILLKQYQADPTSLSKDDRNELQGYINEYAKSNGEAAAFSLLNTGPQLVMENGDINLLRGYAKGLMAGQEQAQWQADAGQPVLATLVPIRAAVGTAVGVVDSFATTTVAVKSGAAVISMAVNGFVQKQTAPNEPINKTELLMSGFTGFATTGAPLLPSMIVNADGALIASTINGENPNASMVAAILGTPAGYPFGKAAETVLIKAGVSGNKPVLWGTAISSWIQETTGSAVNDAIQKGAAQ